MDINLIQWRDAHVPDIGWHSRDQLQDEFDQEFIINSVGFVFDENDKYIALVQNADQDNEKLSNMISIPRDCIIKRDILCHNGYGQ